MLCFNCTSLFHLVILVYVLLYKYEIPKTGQKAVLLIPNHVKGLMHALPYLKSASFISKVIVVNTASGDRNLITTQSSKVSFCNGDVFHLIGWEMIGFTLMRKAASSGIKTVVIEEGMFQIVNLEEQIQTVKKMYAYQDLKLRKEDIAEFWKLDVQNQKIDGDFIDLHMKEQFHSKEFMENFLGYLNEIFPKKECMKRRNEIILFDTHYLQSKRIAGRQMERLLLKKTVEAVSEWDYVIKPHPSDETGWKYEADYKICGDSWVPWEVSVFYDRQEKSGIRIYLSLVPTGAVLNEVSFWGEQTYIIFLHKIYERYGVGPVNYDRLNRFLCSANNKEMHIYFPTRFCEVRQMISKIQGQDQPKQQMFMQQCRQEDEETIQILAEEYRLAVAERPDERNVSSLLGDFNGQWEILDMVPVDTREKQFVFTFQITGKAQYPKFRWYAVRGRKVSIKLEKIELKDEKGCVREVLWGTEKNVEENAEKGGLVFHNMAEEINGYQTFYDFDPVIEFAGMAGIGTVVIYAEIIFDNCYDSTMEAFHERLAREIELRENNIQKTVLENEKLYEEIQKLHHEIDGRDNLVYEIASQRETLERTLSEERILWEKEKTEWMQERQEFVQAVSSLRNFLAYARQKKKRD